MWYRSFDSILDECLAAIRHGESVDACLSRYPTHADRLEPLLQLAQKVRETPPALPRPWPQANAWQRVRQRANELRSSRRPVEISMDYGPWLRPAAITAAVLLALFAATGGTALASQNALPDSPLYRVKLATEEVRLMLVFDDVHRAEILVDQSNERMDEILELRSQDKTIPSNVLSALRSRNERAADIIEHHPEEAELNQTLAQQSQTQEDNLIHLFPDISQSAYTPYTEAVAATHNARLPGAGGLVRIHPEELSDGIQRIAGVAEQVNNDIWTVGGLEVRVDQTTIGQTLQPGATISFVVGKNSRGQLRALTASTIAPGLPPSGSVVSGEVEDVTDQGIIIGGQLISITSDTYRSGKIRKGQKVEVELGTSDAGVVASTVRPATPTAPAGAEQEAPAQLTFEGVIEGDIKRSSNEWKIGGLTFSITPDTALDASAGQAKNGARALVEATNQDGRLSAHSVTVLASDAPADSAALIGTFRSSRNGVWNVSGMQLVPPERTVEPLEGSLLFLDLFRHGDDLNVKSYSVIETPDDTGLVRVDVSISKLDGALWTVDFGTVRVASTAKFSGPEAVEGARALVWGRRNQNGVFEATFARVLDKTGVIATPAPASPVPITAPAGNAGP